MKDTLYRKVEIDGAYSFIPVPESVQHLLPLKWIGQNTSAVTDDYSNSDCGPACVAMWLNYRGVPVTVDDVSRATGKPRGYTSTTFADLDKAANKYGLSLFHYLGTLTLDIIRREIVIGWPLIALVHYPSLPERYDLNYKQSHWILLVGYTDGTFFYHDPYWQTEFDGASIVITGEQLITALQNVAINGNTPMQGIAQQV